MFGEVMKVYWKAIAQLVFEKCHPTWSWHCLSEPDQETWVERVKAAADVLKVF